MSQQAKRPRRDREKRTTNGKKRVLPLVVGAFLVLFALYLTYQLFGNMGRSIRTKEALITTVEDTVDAQGIFIRNQSLVTGKGGSSARYLVENGQRVGKGQQVAMFFSSEAAAHTFQTCQELEHQLTALREAYANLTSGMDSLKMDSMIYDTLKQLAEELDSGHTDGLSPLYASLNQLILSRGNGGDNVALKAQIDRVEAELKAEKAKLSGGSKPVTAPQAGYFIKNADGYETRFDVASISSLTVEDVLQATPDANAAGAIGSLMQDFVWYYAAVVDHDTAEALRNRVTVLARFPKISDALLEMAVVSIRTEGERALVVLKCTDMDAKYLSARRESIQLVLNTYTGIPVPREALRQLEGKWGVYCMDGSVAKFKPVTWIYQTEEYYLVPSAARPADGLYRYDKMILGAKNLFDGQVVQ